MMKVNACVALLAGFVGGILSPHLLPQAVEAQQPLPAPRQVSAQSFALVDANGIPMGVFLVGKPPAPNVAPAIMLLNADGQRIWSVGVRGPQLLLD